MSDKSSDQAPRFSTSSTAAAAAASSAETVPWPGNTFVIRERATGRAIALVDGKLRLKDWDWDYAGDRGTHWVCELKDGWLGFRNPVSGTYIGHDDRGNFRATVSHHQAWEYFCATRHPEGGYLLLKRHGDTLRKMAVDMGGDKFYETTDQGTIWEFLKL
ncbi:hypothetical protein DL766_009636 [Monosporascus sp. MC13-8B]|uniref:Fascin domain-containing protein n=1 Tax=Monosporascus cannonballus TaxID=155416 RepID=A0ABY0H214_9PEZI|nr:hypothetical protein DL762_006445 [Monosporascus cannonballus]RYO86012.1 hypothetical protein DL763_006882 [Monosporascus cannonballus]RYP14577.1 hypothetical protein DL766_009636 [Monosporascus sp. MC13-8B]